MPFLLFIKEKAFYKVQQARKREKCIVNFARAVNEVRNRINQEFGIQEWHVLIW